MDSYEVSNISWELTPKALMKYLGRELMYRLNIMFKGFNGYFFKKGALEAKIMCTHSKPK